jgi:hypothetical protein
MKIYIAARAKYRADEVAKIQGVLKGMGFSIAYAWPSGDVDVRRPYRDPENRKHNLSAQMRMLSAAAKADIFVLLDDEGLRGAYIELGAFLTDCLKNPAGRKAYIVGSNSQTRESIFESPAYVYYPNTIDEVYKDLAKFREEKRT